MLNKTLSNSNLKIIAIISMLIDHIAVVNLFNIENSNLIYLMRIIGRMAFPIFAFLIVEGFYYTRNLNKYFTRLLIFAFISEIPFDLAIYNTIFNFTHQNVFFTLALGLLSISLYDKYKVKSKSLGFIYVLLICLFSIILRTDYNIFGILMIFVFYYFRNNFNLITFNIILINLITFSLIQIFAILSLLFIFLYNNKKGLSLKYLFYVFYPGHLLTLYFLTSYF